MVAHGWDLCPGGWFQAMTCQWFQAQTGLFDGLGVYMFVSHDPMTLLFVSYVRPEI